MLFLFADPGPFPPLFAQSEVIWYIKADSVPNVLHNTQMARPSGGQFPTDSQTCRSPATPLSGTIPLADQTIMYTISQQAGGERQFHLTKRAARLKPFRINLATLNQPRIDLASISGAQFLNTHDCRPHWALRGAGTDAVRERHSRPRPLRPARAFRRLCPAHPDCTLTRCCLITDA